MKNKFEWSALAEARERIREIVEREGLLDREVTVLARPLTPEEAIGTPGRRDFPIIVGKERVVEATVLGTRGQAFTDSPRETISTLKEVLELELSSNQHRAILVATINAVTGHLGLAEGTVHCKDDEPEQCARELADRVFELAGAAEVGLIGLNPAIAERLVDRFGAAHVRMTDLNPVNVGTRKFGAEIWDGRERTEELIDASDFVVFTGTTLVNDTFDAILGRIKERKKGYLVFGMTVAGVSALTGIERICPCSH